MNTLEELLSNGIQLHTAEDMLSRYSKRIGTMSGIYEILDITYDFDIKGSIVVLRCTECGKVITRAMISGRNKWSELIKSCECHKIKKSELAKDESEKILKEKKALILEDAKSMIGTEYGDYSIISITQNEDKVLFNLSCDICGHEISAPYQSIKNNAEKYKKCTKHYNPVKYDESYIGKKKNYLKVIGITRLENNHRAFLCECNCGNIATIEPAFWEQGIIKSCGCYSKSLKLEHSEELDRLRRIHNGMMQRCYNPNSTAYKYYGGRGIEVCLEWHDREVFIEWSLNNGYENYLTIDRKDVNGNYCPENCRWADSVTQANNRRKPVFRKKRGLKTVIVDGIEKPITEWYVIYGVTGATVAYRMKNYGLSFEDALKMPKMTIGRPRKEVKDA